MNVEPRWKTGIRRSKRNKAVEYAKARAFVYERSGGRCEAAVKDQPVLVCTGQGQQAHHVLRRSQGGPDTPENLRWVCFACHVFIHANPAEAERRGLLARSSFSPAPGLVKVERVER